MYVGVIHLEMTEYVKNTKKTRNWEWISLYSKLSERSQYLSASYTKIKKNTISLKHIKSNCIIVNTGFFFDENYIHFILGK